MKNKSQTSPNGIFRQKKNFANTVDTMFAKPRLVRQTGLEMRPALALKFSSIRKAPILRTLR